MKTYILTEENIERLREEFCISKLQSDTFDKMLREFGCISHNEYTEIVHRLKDGYDMSKINIDFTPRKDS